MARGSPRTVDGAAKRHPVLTRQRARRTGGSLVELVVALMLASIVLATAVSTLLRQYRTASELGDAARAGAQHRAAAGAIAGDLALLDAGSGDLVPGEVSDTAIELRAFVGSGMACDAGAGSAMLARDGLPPVGSGTFTVHQGDSLWWFAEVGAEGAWRGAAVRALDSLMAPCAARASARLAVLRLTVGGADTIPFGAPLRVTRKVRYAFYRSGDGSWQLGYRDWNDVVRRLAAPQPVAGPFLMRAGAGRTGFRYFDASGVELGGGTTGVDAAAVARVRLTSLSVDRARMGRDSVRRDSIDVALNRAGWP